MSEPLKLLRTYSPSQTTTFMICGVKWWQTYKAGEHGKGLVPASVTALQIHDRLMGDAGHRMLATWYQTGDMDAGIAAGSEAIAASLQTVTDGGVSIWEAPQAAELQAELARLGRAYVLRYPSEAWTVLAVEQLLTAPATCKLDLLVVDADGEPAVVEHKFPGPKARVIEQAGRWRMGYQPYNYCWAVDEAKQAFGLTKPCRRVIMNFVQRVAKIDPIKHLVRCPFEVKEVLLGIHKQQAARLWAQMSQAEAMHARRVDGVGGKDKPSVNPIWPNWEACDTRWGRCEFIGLCESGWDEAVERGQYREKGGQGVTVHV